MHSWVFAFSHPLLCAPLDSRSAVASIASRGSQPTSTFSDSPSCARREVHLRYAVFRWVFASLPRDFLRFSFAMLAVASMQDLFIASCPLCVSVVHCHTMRVVAFPTCAGLPTLATLASSARALGASAPRPLVPSISLLSRPASLAAGMCRTITALSESAGIVGTHIDCARPWRS